MMQEAMCREARGGVSWCVGAGVGFVGVQLMDNIG